MPWPSFLHGGSKIRKITFLAKKGYGTHKNTIGLLLLWLVSGRCICLLQSPKPKWAVGLMHSLLYSPKCPYVEFSVFTLCIFFLGPEQRLQAVSEGPIEIVLFIIIYHSWPTVLPNFAPFPNWKSCVTLQGRPATPEIRYFWVVAHGPREMAK